MKEKDPRLVRAAEAALELKRRYEDEKLFFYKPCCRVHKLPNGKGNNCPVTPCPDSRHTKIHLSDKRIRIIFGGNRSSKTTTALTEFLMMACLKAHPFRKTQAPRGGRWRIYESDFGVLEKLIIPMVKEWIPRSALRNDGANKEEAWEKSYDKKYHILYLKGDVTLDFMSYDQDASKSESVPLDGVFADEEMPESIFTAVMARLISRNGKFIMAVTPLYHLTWAMKFLDNLDPQVDVFNLEIYDNPYISDQAIKEFEASIPEHEKEARLLGKFMELRGLVYKELRQDIHLIGSDKPKGANHIIFCMDPHPRKPTVMTWAYVSGKDDVVFFDELEMAGTARDIASAIRQKEASFPRPVSLRLIDPAAKAQGSSLAFQTDTLQEFAKEGLNFTLADNSEAGYNVVHEYVSCDPSRPIGPLNRPRCFFTKDVPKTWYGMTHLMWDEWAMGKSLRDDKERIKDWKKDFPDCVRYTLAIRPSSRSFSNVVPVQIRRMVQNGFNPARRQEVRQAVFGSR